VASRRHEDLQALAGPKPTAGISDRAEQVEAPGSRAGRGSPPERATLARAADPHKARRRKLRNAKAAKAEARRSHGPARRHGGGHRLAEFVETPGRVRVDDAARPAGRGEGHEARRRMARMERVYAGRYARPDRAAVDRGLPLRRVGENSLVEVDRPGQGRRRESCRSGDSVRAVRGEVTEAQRADLSGAEG
jgi:hypothetical protein